MHYMKVALNQHWRNSLRANLKRNGMNRIVWDCCVLCHIECSKWVCIPVSLIAKWRQRKSRRKKSEDGTICVCWTMSFSFIAIIMELTYKTFGNIACCFANSEKQGHTSGAQIYICQENGSPHTICLPVYLFFPTLQRAVAESKTKLPNHRNVYLYCSRLTDCKKKWFFVSAYI